MACARLICSLALSAANRGMPHTCHPITRAATVQKTMRPQHCVCEVLLLPYPHNGFELPIAISSCLPAALIMFAEPAVEQRAVTCNTDSPSLHGCFGIPKALHPAK